MVNLRFQKITHSCKKCSKNFKITLDEIVRRKNVRCPFCEEKVCLHLKSTSENFQEKFFESNVLITDLHKSFENRLN